MATLQPQEYDISYFDGEKSTYTHNAGYTRYERWKRFEGQNSTGEFYRDIAKKLVDRFGLTGKKVLELGCAKGFIVKDLRDLGVNAHGLDVSQYAIENCEPEVKAFLVVGDARTYLKNYKNKEFDFIFSRWLLECLDPVDLPNLVSEINRIAKAQLHINRKDVNTQFYVSLSAEDWLKYNWNKGTCVWEDGVIKELIK